MIKKNKAFTLIEILVAIVIIGIMAILMLNISFDSQSDSIKLNKFINDINSLINKELINIRSGKGIKNVSNIINPQKIYISMNTGSIISNYYSGDTLIGTGDIIEFPFYGDESYKIKEFKYEKKDTSIRDISPLPLIIVLENNNTIYFTGYTEKDVSIKINFSVYYKEKFKTIYFDKRSGIINF